MIIDKKMEKLIEKCLKNGRFVPDDETTDEEFEDWAGCKRATREEIKKKNVGLCAKASKEKKFLFKDEIPSEIIIESRWKVENVGYMIDCYYWICVNGVSPSLMFKCFMPSHRRNGRLRFYCGGETMELDCENVIPFYMKAEKIVENGEDEGTMKIKLSYDSGALWEIEKPMTKENVEPIIRILKSVGLKKLPKLLREKTEDKRY